MDNSKEALKNWVSEVLREAIKERGMSIARAIELRLAANRIISQGGWRGDISICWRDECKVTHEEVSDLYL